MTRRAFHPAQATHPARPHLQHADVSSALDVRACNISGPVRRPVRAAVICVGQMQAQRTKHHHMLRALLRQLPLPPPLLLLLLEPDATWCEGLAVSWCLKSRTWRLALIAGSVAAFPCGSLDLETAVLHKERERYRAGDSWEGGGGC
eukprot:1150870-Pelagomonas_calceolata.AAC.14